jgi:hypothetical protein
VLEASQPRHPGVPPGVAVFQNPFAFESEPRQPSLAADAVPAGTASGIVATVQPRRERRFLYALAAAAVVLGLGAVALVGVQPSTLVRTNALLPDSTHRSDEPGARDGTVPAVAVTKPAADTSEADPMLTKRASELPDSDRSASLDRSGALDRAAMTRGLGARAPSQDAPSEEAKLRVSQALQAPKAPPPPVTKKSGKRRAAVAQRAKPAAAAPAAATAASAATTAAPAKQPPTKVDCRQPFWIDEGGIRRLKMACL